MTPPIPPDRSRRRAASTTPYGAALVHLARRDLSAQQLEVRLVRAGYGPEEIETAIARLVRERLLDDHRVALTLARDQQRKGRGPLRVLREVERRGIEHSLAHSVVGEVFAELDEDVLLDRVLARRLRGPVRDLAQLRRLSQALIRQGFAPARILAALKKRGLEPGRWNEE